MKAYRRGCRTDENWFTGTTTCGAPPFGIFYRGQHRANRFSRTVADITAELDAEPPVIDEMVDLFILSRDDPREPAVWVTRKPGGCYRLGFAIHEGTPHE